jgi:hypothetical protein
MGEFNSCRKEDGEVEDQEEESILSLDSKDYRTEIDKCDRAFIDRQSRATSQCLSICCKESQSADHDCLADCEEVDSGDLVALKQLESDANGVAKKLRNPLRAAGGEYIVSDIVMACILIFSGLVFVFFGHKLFRPVLFIAGFYVAGIKLLISYFSRRICVLVILGHRVASRLTHLWRQQTIDSNNNRYCRWIARGRPSNMPLEAWVVCDRHATRLYSW